ncbi:MAG: YciI family protein [Candidatus Binatia bacterium]
MWYIVLSRSLPDREESKKIHIEGHTRWLENQHRAGRLLFSGPTTDGAYGIYILLASNRGEAEKTAAQDPYHLEGVRTMEVLEWRAHRAFRLSGPTIADVERMATEN